MAHINGKPLSIKQDKHKFDAHPGLFERKFHKRDNNGRKFTKKGAKHAKNTQGDWNPFESPTISNHERHKLRKFARMARIKQEDAEDAPFRRKIVK